MRRLINRNTYRDYKINSGEIGKTPCNSFSLDQGIDRLEYMIGKHGKVLCVRLDFHQPSDSEIQIRSEMAKILEAGKRMLNSQFRDKPNKPDLQYIWKAEHTSSKHEHVHAFFMVNGNAIQNGYRLLRIFNDTLKSHYHTDNDGLVQFCPSNGKYGKRIDRNSFDFKNQMDDAVYQMSYITKTRYDENKPKGSRISSASRLPR